jgi:hypothetical protein
MQNIITMCVHRGMTTTELVDQMHKMKRFREQRNCIIACTIMGYDKDPRELWEIPEIRMFAGRLFVELGYISWLDVQYEPIPGVKGRPFFALDIWALSQGKLAPTFTYNPQEFRHALTTANEVADRIMREYPESDQNLTTTVEL